MPTRFFYAMQQVFWGKERCIQLISWAQYNQVKVKMNRTMSLVTKWSKKRHQSNEIKNRFCRCVVADNCHRATVNS